MSTLHLVLVAALLVNIQPQQSSDTSNPTDIEIVKFSWNIYINFAGLNSTTLPPVRKGPTAPPPAGQPDSPVGPPDGRLHPQGTATQMYQYKLKIRNTGTKVIVGLLWSYVFSDASGAEVGRRQFNNTRDFKLAPGKAKEVMHLSRSQPSDVVNATAPTNNDNLRGRIEIERVFYSDGSKWERLNGSL